jgi:hypothetical protein
MEELAIGPGASQSGLRPNMSSSARKRPGHRLRLFLASGRHDNFTRDAHVRLLPPRAESLSEFDSEMQWFESCRPNQSVRLKRVKYEGRSKTARYRANSVRRSRRSVPAAPSCAQNQNEHTPFEVGGPELDLRRRGPWTPPRGAIYRADRDARQALQPVRGNSRRSVRLSYRRWSRV